MSDLDRVPPAGGERGSYLDAIKKTHPYPKAQAGGGADVAEIREALNVWTQERALAALDRLAARIEELREGERNWQKLYYESRDRAEAAKARIAELESELHQWRTSIATEDLTWRAEAAEARVAELEAENKMMRDHSYFQEFSHKIAELKTIIERQDVTIGALYRQQRLAQDRLEQARAELRGDKRRLPTSDEEGGTK
jgi:hypothetical protein